MAPGCCIHRSVRCCRPYFARDHVGQKQGPACWQSKHTDVGLHRRFAVLLAAQQEPRAQQIAIGWAKIPQGRRPVRQFLEDKRKQPRKPKLEQDVERLSKVVAATGVATYKKAHAVILAGRVKVNGKVVKEPTHLVNPTADEIYIHGSLVEPRQQHRCEPSPRNDTSDAESGGMVRQKLFLAGRLDSETCGLQLITTDADWADRVTRSPEVQQEFIATIGSCPERWQIDLMVQGCDTEGLALKPVHVSVFRTVRHPSVWRLRIVVEKVRARSVRRLVSNAGLRCLRLQRVRVGPVRLPDRLHPGHGMEMSEADVSRVIDAQATRSMILNKASDMVVAGPIKPFRVPRKPLHCRATVNLLRGTQPLTSQ